MTNEQTVLFPEPESTEIADKTAINTEERTKRIKIHRESLTLFL